ncbi:hypothetical protein [Nonomuraea indica]|uniref:hypothetical protein n=1 Tax=Nonomuraea indica TaxID=1581193 RepID=UPI000C7A4D60|nr:hypothetical protein [Nonomuraea indica]
MVTIKVDCPDDVAADQRREFADTVIGAAVDLLGAERTGVLLHVGERDGARHDTTAEDEAARREAAFWAAAWSGC